MALHTSPCVTNAVHTLASFKLEYITCKIWIN
jgi:hypothetical protein